MSTILSVFMCWLAIVHSLPPDKHLQPVHIIKTRSIDLNNAHGLSKETRLELVVEPTLYQIKIEPYLDETDFKGEIKIDLTWLKDADEIVLHADQELTITETEIYVAPKGSDKLEKIKITSAMNDVKKPLYYIRLSKAITAESKGYIEMKYSGHMQMASSEAFFKSIYINENEVATVVAGTQLRPNNARRVFPCFDEPALKAPIKFSVVRPRNMVALSNMASEAVKDIPGEPDAVWEEFLQSPPMSTYTFGFIIAEIKQLGNATYYRDEENGNNIEIKVWGRQEFLPALEGVTEKVAKVFKQLADYWAVPLPIKKLDIVALPNYQGVKPADNWGLVIFKESDLTGRGYFQLAQELSYQWLGSYATPSWWTDAHLNKALVGYLAADTVYKINNGEDLEGKWPMTVLYSLYYEYSKRYPHSRITGMKQETACTKIELLFRMFNCTLGGHKFKIGLRTFLEKRKFKTFTGDDLWNTLDDVSTSYGKEPKEFHFKTVADSWIKKDRLPLVTVTRDYEKNTAVVKQKVFLRERPHDVPDAASLTWWIPLVMVRSDNLNFTNTTPVAWVKNVKEVTLDNLPKKDQFIIVNPEEIGPFPVNYDTENWNLLLKYLMSENRMKIPELTRAKLLHDAWNLAYAGELSFATAFNMTLFLKDERHPSVWNPVFTMIDHIGRHICQCIHGKFQAFVRTLLTPLYEELTKNKKEDEENWRKNLRGITKTFLCRAGYKPCVKEAQEHYRKWMEANNPDEGNPLLNQYICPVFKWGTQEEWDFGLQRVINFPPSRKQNERTYLLKTLAGCPVDEYKIKKLLNIVVLEGNGNFTETDMFLIFSMLTGSPQGYTTLFHFLNGTWDTLRPRYINKTNLWDSLISSATSEFTTQEGLDMVSKLFVDHQGEFGSAEHIIEKSMKNIREEAKWSAENLPVIDKWIDGYLAANKQAIEAN